MFISKRNHPIDPSIEIMQMSVCSDPIAHKNLEDFQIGHFDGETFLARATCRFSCKRLHNVLSVSLQIRVSKSRGFETKSVKRALSPGPRFPEQARI